MGGTALRGLGSLRSRWAFLGCALALACSEPSAPAGSDGGADGGTAADAADGSGGRDGASGDGGGDGGGDACTVADGDGDGYDAPSCGGNDCDDGNASRHPGASEVCDAAELDEDCDPTTFGTRDADGDGQIDAACCNAADDGTRTCGPDCDDARADVSLGAPDFCDGRDNDCDGATDEAPTETYFPDGDGDGYGDGGGAAMSACSRPVGYVADDTDCDDARAATNPAAPEVCDTFDNDCDTHVDEGTAAPATFYRDMDGDGYGGPTTIVQCTTPAGYVQLGGDCDDTRATANPGAPEVCEDGTPIDNDCNGLANDGAAAPRTWYRDADGDLYGSTTSTVACNAPSGFVGNATDCNDAVAAVHPGATEICNGMDDDCNAGTSDASTCSCTPLGGTRSCGVGWCAGGMQMCTLTGWSSCGAFTPRSETCNGVDDDCDGMSDELPDATATCPTYPRSAPRCRVGGGCTFACDAGYADCDTNATNGCEVLLASGTRVSDDQVDHCGTCPTSCTITSNGSVSTAACTSGACTMTCAGTRANCNGNYADGCEVERASDLSNCGACGTRCTAAPANGVPVCTASACTFNCNAGYYRSGASCLAIPAPRPIYPTSTSLVTSACPVLRWSLASPTDGVELQVCRDRACAMVVGTLSATGSSAGLCTVPGVTGEARLFFWRARGRIGTSFGSQWSPTWQVRLVLGRVATVPDAGGTVVGSELDLRGDGLPDLAIGENEADRLRLYFGATAGLPAGPSATITGPDGSAGRFGISATSAGDVNGDGFGDLLVGASGPNGASGDMPSAATNLNTAYLYLGSAGAPGAAATRLTPSAGASSGSGFGYAISSAGDVNQDGYGDVVVGAYWDERAYVYLGSASGLSTTPAVTLSAPDATTGGHFGVAVVGTDLNADHYTDVVVGRPLVSPAIYVYCGSASGIGTTPCATYVGTAGSNLGLSLAAGDVTSDGAPDLVASGNGGNGVVQVFLGRSTTFDTTADVTWTGTATGTGFGVSVTTLSFIDPDYTSDVIVGAPTSGSVYVFAVPATPFSGTTANARATLTSASAQFGRYVARAGAIRGGTQHADLVVGGCNPGVLPSTAASCSNTVWLWEGSYMGTPDAAPTLTRTGTSGFGLACDR